MKISIICSDKKHPINKKLHDWKSQKMSLHQIEIVNKINELSGGDFLFLISCHDIIGLNTRSRYENCLIVHASDLPKGRGWSPLNWQIIEGATDITVTLLEAEDKVDTGKVWHQVKIKIEQHELMDEINEKLFDAEIKLLDIAIENHKEIIPAGQPDREITYYPKRTSEDSRIDPNRSIAEQFDLIRVCDPARYPAFFELWGYRYKITLEKMH